MQRYKLGDCSISKTKSIYKFERGAINYWTSAQSKSNCVAWKDNKSVYVASNCDRIKPLPQVQQWNRQKQANVAISQS